MIKVKDADNSIFLNKILKENQLKQYKQPNFCELFVGFFYTAYVSTTNYALTIKSLQMKLLQRIQRTGS